MRKRPPLPSPATPRAHGTAGKRRSRPELVTATEIACWAYCPEQWRLQHGLGLSAENGAARAAGVRHHARKALAVRIAGIAIVLGRLLIVLATVLVLLLLWWQR